MSSGAANTTRPIPYIRIIHQPSQVYRMRYKAEKRTTFLYAENFQSNDKTKDGNSSGSASAQGAKKTALPRKKAVQGGSDHPDGMFPKIEVRTARKASSTFCLVKSNVSFI